jgi:hypothetical protein
MGKATKQLKNREEKTKKRFFKALENREQIEQMKDDKYYEFKGFSLTGKAWKSYL